MKKFITLASIALAATALGGTVFAQAQTPSTDGEVIKVDKAAAKITLKHGEIKTLDMPAMTMAYRVADPRMLDSVAAGDHVRFAAAKLGGNYTLTALVKAP